MERILLQLFVNVLHGLQLTAWVSHSSRRRMALTGEQYHAGFRSIRTAVEPLLIGKLEVIDLASSKS